MGLIQNDIGGSMLSLFFVEMMHVLKKTTVIRQHKVHK